MSNLVDEREERRMSLIADSFAVEILNNDGKWKEISEILVSKYFEKPDKGFRLHDECERLLGAYRKESNKPIVRLVTMKYDEQHNTIESFMAIEFYSWVISNGKVLALADSVRKYSLSESEYKEQLVI